MTLGAESINETDIETNPLFTAINKQIKEAEWATSAAKAKDLLTPAVTGLNKALSIKGDVTLSTVEGHGQAVFTINGTSDTITLKATSGDGNVTAAPSQDKTTTTVTIKNIQFQSAEGETTTDIETNPLFTAINKQIKEAEWATSAAKAKDLLTPAVTGLNKALSIKGDVTLSTVEGHGQAVFTINGTSDTITLKATSGDGNVTAAPSQDKTTTTVTIKNIQFQTV